jgi:hypothetical protein
LYFEATAAPCYFTETYPTVSYQKA